MAAISFMSSHIFRNNVNCITYVYFSSGICPSRRIPRSESGSVSVLRLVWIRQKGSSLALNKATTFFLNTETGSITMCYFRSTSRRTKAGNQVILRAVHVASSDWFNRLSNIRNSQHLWPRLRRYFTQMLNSRIPSKKSFHNNRFTIDRYGGIASGEICNRYFLRRRYWAITIDHIWCSAVSSASARTSYGTLSQYQKLFLLLHHVTSHWILSRW